MSALTKAQRDMLAFMKAHQEREGVTPSFEEMMLAMGLRSKSGIHRLVSALEERGYIRRIPNRARAIEILPEPHLPDSATLGWIATNALAKELRRRGYVTGWYQHEPIRVGETRKERRRFVEIAA